MSHEEDDEESLVDSLGIWGMGDGASIMSEPYSPVGRDAVVAPIVPSALQLGTTMTKVTKKKRKTFTFSLDLETAKVYWNPTNPAKKFYIDDIKEIRVREDARNYRQELGVGASDESRWFTILYADPERTKGRSIKTMHLIAPNEELVDEWTNTLENVSKHRADLMVGLTGPNQSEGALQAHWQREMNRLYPGNHRTEDLENLDLPAVENLCRSLHINCSKNIIRAQFSKADTSHSGRLNYNEFKEFVRGIKERKDVKEIFKLWTQDHKEGMTQDEFLSFMTKSQGISLQAEPNKWIAMFEKCVRESKDRGSQHDVVFCTESRMSFEAFCSFLTSSQSGVHASSAPEVKLDRPMNDYFIASSHNTYLLGRQVAGESSTEAYISALQRGCRCVEIDCWDGPDGRPIVLHGRTMTSSVLFADCISVINQFAFHASDYPLILSLEVHCNEKQQVEMAEIMRKGMGDQLLLDYLPTHTTRLPSPEDLKRRILVKVKTSEESEGSSPFPEPNEAGRMRSASSPFSRPTVPDSAAPFNLPPLSSPPTMSPPDASVPFPAFSPGQRSMTTTSVSSATEDSDAPQSRASSVRRERRRKSHKSNITQKLADLGIYTRGQKFRDFTSSDSRRYNYVFSFAERTVEGICRTPNGKPQFERHNIDHLCRVYPSGYRFKSSNFDPNTFWRRGVQMVALNWQTYDVGMQINQAMFAAGRDRTGYVLKPESLRQAPEVNGIEADLNVRPKLEKSLVKFSVDMISAQQLPRFHGLGNDGNINPYIEIEMFSAEDKSKGIAFGEGGHDASARNGVSGIGYPHRRRTKIEVNNGYNPTFNDNFTLSLETKYPDLVFVRWVVWNSIDGRSYNNKNNVQLATFTSKLSSLQQGYRHLPLFDATGEQFLFCTLFCKIKKEEPIPLGSFEEIRSERLGIFRQLSQNFMKRTLSHERESRERGKRSSEEKKSSLEVDSQRARAPSHSEVEES